MSKFYVEAVCNDCHAEFVGDPDDVQQQLDQHDAQGCPGVTVKGER